MERTLKEKLPQIYEKIEKKIQAECLRLGDEIPYISEAGEYKKDMRKVNLSWWTNGFFAGILWQLYQDTGNELYRQTALHTEEAFDRALEKYEGLHHDVGFMFLHSAVADYRVTQNPQSRVRGLHAANLLAGRFNPSGQFIRAWNLDRTGWMIVDCLMNLPLLYWAGGEMSDPRFADIACRHADTAMRVLLREDGSCNHIAILDPVTGEVQGLPAGQGYQEGSSWSRGQAWAIYGFALAYLHSKKETYLHAAKRAAHYFIANVSATGYVSLCDFRSPKEPVIWDTTAAACAACGLLQIGEMVPEYEKALYQDNAERILTALCENHCDWDIQRDGILQNGTAAYGKKEEEHVPIIYGDYFLTEGIMRLLGKGFLIW